MSFRAKMDLCLICRWSLKKIKINMPMYIHTYIHILGHQVVALPQCKHTQKHEVCGASCGWGVLGYECALHGVSYTTSIPPLNLCVLMCVCNLGLGFRGSWSTTPYLLNWPVTRKDPPSKGNTHTHTLSLSLSL